MIQRMTTCIIQDGVDKEVVVNNTMTELILILTPLLMS